MDTASIGLCKDLSELSGWESPMTWAAPSEGNTLLVRSDDTNLGHDIHRVAYAYDLGFLVRKLHDTGSWLSITPKGYMATWSDKKRRTVSVAESSLINVEADTPEDAFAGLAIDLFERGIFAHPNNTK